MKDYNRYNRVVRVKLSQYEIDCLKRVQEAFLEKGNRLNMLAFIRNLITNYDYIEQCKKTNDINDIIGKEVIYNPDDTDISYKCIIDGYEFEIEDKFPYNGRLLFYLNPINENEVNKDDLTQMKSGGVFLEELQFTEKYTSGIVI